MIEDEVKQKKATVKSCSIRLALSVVAYALGIFILTMDADIGMKIFLSILFCGLPSAIGRSSRKMEKLLKKNEGKTVVIVKKKKQGIIMKILKAIFNLAIGYIATPYLCYQYIMTIVRTQKEIKGLQGGGTIKVSENAVGSQTGVAQSDEGVPQTVSENKTESGATSDDSFVEVASDVDGNGEKATGAQPVPYVPIATPVGNANLQTRPVSTVGSGMVKIPVNPSWFAVVLAILPILVFAVKMLVQLHIAFNSFEDSSSDNTSLYFIYVFFMLIIAESVAAICYGLKSCISEIKYKKLNRWFAMGVTIYTIAIFFLVFIISLSIMNGSSSGFKMNAGDIGMVIDIAIGPVLALIYYIYVRVAVFTESRYEEKREIPAEKKKKIAVAGIVVTLVSVMFCFPIASSISNLFSKEISGADSIDLGMSKSQVIEILGTPYKETGSVLTYFNSSYAKKLDKIDNANIDDVEDLEDLEDALKEEEEVINAYHYELVVTFVSDKVWNVSYRAYEEDKAVGEVEGDVLLEFADDTYSVFENGGLYAKYEVNYSEGYEKGYTEVSYRNIELTDITTTLPGIKIDWKAGKEKKEISGTLNLTLNELDNKYGATKVVLGYYNDNFSYSDYASASESTIDAYDAILKKYGLYRNWLADFER